VSSAADDVAYVSLPPGTVSTGRTATIRRVGDGGSIITTVRDGGFDPVPVEANVGDSIEVLVADASGAPIRTLGLVVAARRPPIVVRTDPPRKKTDVPLNAAMVVVFSEPVAGGTLTSSSVQLLRGASAVAGTVRLLEGTGTIAAFTPAAPLEPNADYHLSVTEAVRDLGGDALETGVTVEFTTGSSFLGPPASLTLSPDTVTITAEATYQLTATVRDAAGNLLIDQPIAWITNDTLGLRVSATGLLTAQTPGLYILTATLNGLAAFARVIVTPGTPASVTISPQQASVAAQGDTIILTATVYDARGRLIRYPSLTWTSTAPALATVAAYGPVGSGLATVTGVSQGGVTITATSGTVSGTAFVTVTPPLPVASVTVAPASATLLLRFTKQLSVTVMDRNGRVLPGRPVTWTSDNAAVATVDANGLVTAVGAGTANVIASAEGVSDSAAITGIVLNLESVTAGAFHSCGLTANGAAHCWGYNQYGQLGDGSTNSRLVAVEVTGGLTFSALSTSSFHTCGLTTDGAAYCWGLNIGGQLGDGSTTSSSVPIAVTGGLTFSGISTGQGHSCGVITSGAAYCWGNNGDGQLGDGSTTSSTVPVAVTGGLTFSAVSTATGGGHNCGLTTDGGAYCWGYNGYGELGTGSTTSSPVPVAVTGGLTFSTINTGRFHACGLTTSGAAYCWGANGDGQLGDGTTVNRLAPVGVSGGLAFVALAGGHYHTCGLTTGGAAYCWGWNEFGGLGDGTLVGRLTPVAVTGGLTFAEVPRGGYGHSCARASTGTAYCWGYNYFAQLGDGTTTSSNVPVRVAGQP
jgi:alpha-tubulin suppressor-like RCC1 family protein